MPNFYELSSVFRWWDSGQTLLVSQNVASILMERSINTPKTYWTTQQLILKYLWFTWLTNIYQIWIILKLKLSTLIDKHIDNNLRRISVSKIIVFSHTDKRHVELFSANFADKLIYLNVVWFSNVGIDDCYHKIHLRSFCVLGLWIPGLYS